ncbi:MAG: tripartite tricarboxylate transporter permease [Peptococcaceae bacterium]
MNDLFIGLASIFTLKTILYICVGLTMGMIVGALPGLNAATGVAIMLPFTYQMDIGVAIIFLTALYCGAVYAGCIPAILVGVPGTTASAATLLEGHIMQQNGDGAKALGVATIASGIGGIVGTILLITMVIPLAKVALSFGPPEYFALSVFGLSIVARLAAKNIGKGVFATLIGLTIASVGADPFWSVPRFTFGFESLSDGIEFMPVLIGAFAISEVLIQAEEGNFNAKYMSHKPKIREMIPKAKEIISYLRTIIYSGTIGTLIGVMPGAGATIANFIAYNEGKRISKHPELFGTGYPEGVAACESGNNGAAPGALVPLLALGIPGSGTTALILTAFILHGVRPGPLLFTQQSEVVNSIFGGLLVSNVLLIVIGFLGVRFWSSMVNIPRNLLLAMIIVLAMMGTFSVNYSTMSVFIMLISGLMGYGMKKANIPIAPMVLGVVLGFLMETSFRRGLAISGGSLMIFFERPITVVLLIISLLSVVTAIVPIKIPFFIKKNKAV